MPLYEIDTQGELHPFLNQEWLLTNGIGGFASSTLVGCNTRRYHGLLCSAEMPPVGRMIMLNRIGELVFLDGRQDFFELSINQFRNSLHPRGDRYLRRFSLDQTARWAFELEGVKISKELTIAWKRNAAGIRYTIEAPAGREVELHLLMFVSMRDFHSLRHSGAVFETTCETWQATVRHHNHKLFFQADAGRFERRADWWYGHVYPVESERGLDDTEDLYVPLVLTHKMIGSGQVTLWARTDEPGMLEWEQEVQRRPDPLEKWPSAGPSSGASGAMRKLARAAADFVVARKRPDGKAGTTVIAGYPWFSDWGRDTMIALPGLLLSTRRFEEARQVLSVFADHISEGMIPNRFEDYTNEPSYNTVDASLWFIHACFEYLRISGDRQTFEQTLLEACRSIVRGFRKGTRYHIKMDEKDGLVSAGDDHTQLTWMDAKCEGIAFTPRHGKAVEINALWYNALVLLNEETLAAKVKESFGRTFWLSPFRGLYDCVVGDQKDGSIRPNQIFAVSLPNSPLNEEQQRAVVEVVRRELLTPYGLRSLARGDGCYQGRYTGPPMQRDRAYHNGTIWGWLIGPFLEAYLRVHQRSPDAMRQARVWLQPLIDHMHKSCIGQISECFEGDEPHRPVGCPAQAWSVAEALRLAETLGI